MTILETRSTRVPQGNRRRRNGATPSGVVVVHTAENTSDFLGPDPGAEAVARFICNRTSYGSYHHLSDSDSGVQVAPWSWEAFHDTGTNNHSIGISAAIECRHWNELDDRGERIVKRMAAAAADFARWLLTEYGIRIPARRITREESRRRVPGFLGHGDSDPGRRHDPGDEFDWDLFLSEFARLTSTTGPAGTGPAPNPAAAPAATQEENIMLLFKWGRTRYRALQGGAFRGIDGGTAEAISAQYKLPIIGITDAQHQDLVDNWNGAPVLVREED